jgi:hypothetical protein
MIARPDVTVPDDADSPAKFRFVLLPFEGRSKADKEMEVIVDVDYVRTLRDLCDDVLKEAGAQAAIQKELDEYRYQLADEREAMIQRKRAELRAKHGFPPDAKDEEAAESERQEALDVLKAMGDEKGD